MLRLRKEYRELFTHGAFEVLDFENLEAFCFVKLREEKRALIALNFTSLPQPFTQAVLAGQMKLLSATMLAIEYITALRAEDLHIVTGAFRIDMEQVDHNRIKEDIERCLHVASFVHIVL